MTEFIYIITCTANGKQYVGKAKDVNVRWATHKRELRKGTHVNHCLQNAWNKHGEHSFTFKTIEEVSADKVFEREMALIELYDTYHNGFNLTKGGEGGNGLALAKTKLLAKIHLTEGDIYDIYFDTYSSLADLAFYYGITIEEVSKIQAKRLLTVFTQKLPQIKRDYHELLTEGAEQMGIYNEFGGNYRKINGKRVLLTY